MVKEPQRKFKTSYFSYIEYVIEVTYVGNTKVIWITNKEKNYKSRG